MKNPFGSSSGAGTRAVQRPSVGTTSTATAGDFDEKHGHAAGATTQSRRKGLGIGFGGDGSVRFLTGWSFSMGVLVSMGGFIFGYDTGQISGLLAMEDFLRRFGQRQSDGTYVFGNVRSGLIVGLLSIGTLIGALIMAPVADRVGRRLSIVLWALVDMVGLIIQITSTHSWVQIAIGRLVAGAGVGALSILVPLYNAETGPRHVRGALISTYQLFITAGIFTADCVNYGTESRDNASSWRISMGVAFIWPAILAIGILLFPESPRYAYRKGRIDEAAATMSKMYGVDRSHTAVRRELAEIKEKHDEDVAHGQRSWVELFTGPRMAYRTILGVVLQALQQLTGANYFFYFATTIFKSVGLANSFVTAMILGGINFGMTFFGLYVVERFGRRRALIWGGVGMTISFFIFASVGGFALNLNDPQATQPAGTAMIVFACTFITSYAITWGPIIWCIVGELFPSQYRARSMALVTCSNWTWNFLIAFFTVYITNSIHFLYGYVFAGCNLAAIFIVYFFVCETQGRTLEQIDDMYRSRVKPWHSSKWQPAEWKEDTASSTKGGAGDVEKEAVRNVEA